MSFQICFNTTGKKVKYPKNITTAKNSPYPKIYKEKTLNKVNKTN